MGRHAEHAIDNGHRSADICIGWECRYRLPACVVAWGDGAGYVYGRSGGRCSCKMCVVLGKLCEEESWMSMYRNFDMERTVERVDGAKQDRAMLAVGFE
jgi:hypothetical protein